MMLSQGITAYETSLVHATLTGIVAFLNPPGTLQRRFSALV
jgi:hypothetical protein